MVVMIMLVEGSRLVSTNQQGGRHQCRSPNTHFRRMRRTRRGWTKCPSTLSEKVRMRYMAREKCTVQIPT